MNPMEFRSTPISRMAVVSLAVSMLFGCASPGTYRKNADKTALKIVEQKQMEALGRTEPFTIETPEKSLRRKLMLDQNLQYSSPASLGSKDLDEIDHWPKDDYLDGGSVEGATVPVILDIPEQLTLLDALKIAAQNSRQYQSAKETVYRSALRLDLSRDNYRSTFTGSLDSNISADLGGNQTTSGVENSAGFGLTRRFLNGISLTTRIGIDLAKMLNPFDEVSSGAFGDTSVTIPLLRGAGRHIVAEPLKQAERDTVYAIYDFERFKREFAVNIAVNYLSVLQSIDQITNSEENYRSVVTSTRRTRRLGDAGQIEPVAVDQAIQSTFSARERWIRALNTYERNLDSFKIQLGLPTDAHIELDRSELDKLAASVEERIPRPEMQLEEDIPPADAEVKLEPPNLEYAGPYEIDDQRAIKLALENRLDLRIANGDVYDAQRRVVVAADALRPEITLLGSASYGEGRSLGSASRGDNFDLDLEKGRYNALLTLDLPLERTSQMVSYRESIISLESTVRNLQNLEDSIKLDVRNALRNLQQVRESLRIQEQAEELARRRVDMTDLLLQAGRVEIRDLLEAKDALLSAQNSLTAARIDYRLTELELQRDMGLLLVDENGLWTEIPTEELKDDNS